MAYPSPSSFAESTYLRKQLNCSLSAFSRVMPRRSTSPPLALPFQRLRILIDRLRHSGNTARVGFWKARQNDALRRMGLAATAPLSRIVHLRRNSSRLLRLRRAHALLSSDVQLLGNVLGFSRYTEWSALFNRLNGRLSTLEAFIQAYN